RGEIYFEGRKVRFKSPRDARQLGIEMVYQDLALLDTMNIWRNFFLGKELVKSVGPFKILDKHAMKKLSADFLTEIGIRVRSVDETVGVLSGGERQSIAIARTVYFGAKLLILDEPTTALSFKEAEQVLRYINDLKKKGLGIVVISHNIYHVYEVADRFTILDKGVKVADYLYKKDVEPQDIIDIIVKKKFS
ncbi:MAG: sugar ABC transporter ATP-binding protein, partial [Thermoprotei archaeon]